MSDRKKTFGRLKDTAQDKAGHMAESVSGTAKEALDDRHDEASRAASEGASTTKEKVNRLLKS